MNDSQKEIAQLPVVEIFQSLEGEGTKAGFLTTFIRLFGCNLRCSWCDTKYSYESESTPEYLKITDIVDRVMQYQSRNICLTGGEPLLHGDNSVEMIKSLTQLDLVVDLHVETNGAVDLEPFANLRKQDFLTNRKLRFIMDYKLPSSGETAKMLTANFDMLLEQDEIKFVIADEQDFWVATEVMERWYFRGQPLFSPVWGKMDLEKMASLLIENNLKSAKLNLPFHKIIWGTKQGV